MSSFDSNKFLSYSIYMEKRHQQRSNSNLLRELENSQQSNVSYHTLVENKAYQWIDDNSVNDCYDCHKFFSFFTRKHHCRYCGRIF